MKEIKLTKVKFENFKKLNTEIQFSDNQTWISAANKTGKSSIADGIFWVLFGKSSTGKSEGKEFRPRPYDESGVDVDHIDVSVELTLLIDGIEVLLKKTQRQNWVRKRGTTTEVHEGDGNIYSWNNVEISETEFKNRISDIVNEKNFMLLTDPTAFFRLKKDEKKDLILSLIANITEEEILIDSGDFPELLTMVRSGKTLEEIKATAKRSVTDMTKERDKISAFINERSKDIVDLDVSDLELQRNIIKEKIAEIDRKIDDTASAISEYDKKSNHILDLKFEQSEIERKANEELVNQKKSLQRRADEADDDFSIAMRRQRECELEIERLERVIQSGNEKRQELIGYFQVEKSKKFRDYDPLPPLDENAFICPYCGQTLTEEHKQKVSAEYEEKCRKHREEYEQEKASFIAAQKSTIRKINEDGSACAENIKSSQEDLKAAKEALQKAMDDKVESNKAKNDATDKLNALPKSADLSDNQVYESLTAEILKCEEALKAMNTGADYRKQLRNERAEWEQRLQEVNSKFSAHDRSIDAEERVAELEKQFKQKVQLIANQERILMMCEEFQTYKDNYLTDAVNKRFKNVRFQLFRKQKNGGVERVCDVYTKDGSPYGDNTTSGAEKLIMGLEIINVLSGILNTKVPVIIDNAERVSEGNMPELDTQMIVLSVSNDKGFRIEGR